MADIEVQILQNTGLDTLSYKPNGYKHTLVEIR